MFSKIRQSRKKRQRPEPKPPVPITEFGVAGGLQGPDAALHWRDLGARWIRYPVDYTPGATATGMRRRILAAADTFRGAKFLATVAAKGILPDPIDFKAFLRELLIAGRDIVDAWQVWNEAEGTTWFPGTAEQYLELLRIAYDEFKAPTATPDAPVLCAGWTGTVSTIGAMLARDDSIGQIAAHFGFSETIPPDLLAAYRRSLDFIEQVMAEGDYDACDLHLYEDPETIPPRVAWLRTLARGKPVWATEIGGPDERFPPEWSEEEQARQVVRRMTLVQEAGVEEARVQLACHLNLFDTTNQGPNYNHMGLVTREGRRKPAYAAYRQFLAG